MIEKWQAFLQQIVALTSRGYHFYHYTQYPLKKQKKWPKIDEKLIKKYDANLDRFKAYRRKKNGLAKVKVIRWHNHCLILHTAGTLPDTGDSDKFYDINDNPFNIRISDRLAFTISVNRGRIAVRLDRESYRAIKAKLQETCDQKSRSNILRQFDRLNGLPAYRGINEQKYMIRDFVVGSARRHQVKLSKKDLRINTKRKIYRVFEADRE